MTSDRDILDVVIDMCRELKRDASFREYLKKLDDDVAREVGKRFVDWLYLTLDVMDEG
jgi:hypothetical protein